MSDPLNYKEMEKERMKCKNVNASETSYWHGIAE